MLSDASLEPIWEKLNAIGATVFSHPNAYAQPRDGRPSPLIEVAFETCRVIVDMVYRKIFARYPDIKFIFSHCGGALPILAGRLDIGMYTDDCSASGCSDLEELTICCRRLSCT